MNEFPARVYDSVFATFMVVLLLAMDVLITEPAVLKFIVISYNHTPVIAPMVPDANVYPMKVVLEVPLNVMSPKDNSVLYPILVLNVVGVVNDICATVITPVVCKVVTEIPVAVNPVVVIPPVEVISPPKVDVFVTPRIPVYIELPVVIPPVAVSSCPTNILVVVVAPVKHTASSVEAEEEDDEVTHARVFPVIPRICPFVPVSELITMEPILSILDVIPDPLAFIPPVVVISPPNVEVLDTPNTPV